MGTFVIFMVGCVCGFIAGIFFSAIIVASGSVGTDHDELDDGVDEVIDNIKNKIQK